MRTSCATSDNKTTPPPPSSLGNKNKLSPFYRDEGIMSGREKQKSREIDIRMEDHATLLLQY